MSTYLIFMACVAVATYAQNLTGFAFGLILLGLVAVLHVVPVADAANAAMVLTLVNAFTYFRGGQEPPPWRLMRPALAASCIGVGLGVALLGWLSGNAVHWLRGLLGLAIVACAVVLLLQRQALPRLSPPRSFAAVGLVSGVLGGLFASSGPPMVYHMYRQPLPPEVVRRALLLMFAINAGSRLVFVLATGQYDRRSALLSACAVPVVYGVTLFTQRHPSPVSPRVLKAVVAALLVFAGGTLLVSSAAALLGHGR